MYQLKNYLLSMQSHWMINQPTYNAVQETLPLIAEYRTNNGLVDMPKTPVHKVVKKIYPEIYKVPLFRRHFCKLLVKEIEMMKKEISFVVQTVLNPIFNALWQRNCADPTTIQIANYNLIDKKQGAWHHDDSSDISVVVPLNTGSYEGGGTAFHNYGEINPLPVGHALMPVASGDRYLLVFWLCDKQRTIDLYESLT